ncbi:MAG TPA: phosphatase PAP2 family protein [Anaerolineales bacterium]
MEEDSRQITTFPGSGRGLEAVIFVAGWLIWGLLAINVIESGPLVQYDQPLALALHQQALAGPAWVIEVMKFLSFMGKHGITTLLIAFGLFWLFHKQWREIIMAALGVGGGTLVFWGLAGLVHRSRPVLPQPFDTIPFSSFPSGHMINSVSFYLLLLYLVWPGLKSGFVRALFLIFTVGLLLSIAFSRLYLGDHFLTDVIAGAAVGLAWSVLVYPGVDAYLKRRHAKKMAAQSR